MARQSDVQLRRGNDVAILHVSGDVGPFAHSRIRSLLVEALTEPAPSEIVLDLTDVTFIDRHGFAVVEFARRTVEAQGVAFIVVNGPVAEAAERSHLAEDRRRASRSGTGPIRVDCRLCWRRIELDAERIEIAEGRIVYRCQHCDSPFLIRADDAESLGLSGA